MLQHLWVVQKVLANMGGTRDIARSGSQREGFVFDFERFKLPGEIGDPECARSPKREALGVALQ